MINLRNDIGKVWRLGRTMDREFDAGFQYFAPARAVVWVDVERDLHSKIRVFLGQAIEEALKK